MSSALSVSSESVDFYIRLLPKSFHALVEAPLENIRLWTGLAWIETVQSYRRTMLGPLWITVNLLIVTIAMTLVYGAIFSVPTREYAAFVSCGMIGWFWVGAMLTDVGNTFVNYGPFIKGTLIKKSIFIWTTASKLIIVLCHHLIVWIGLALLKVVDVTIYSLFLPLAIIVMFLFSIPITAVAAILFARYRDLQRLIASTMTILLMVTPIFWQTNLISGWRTAVFHLNPIYYLIEFIRAPLLGKPEDPVVVAVVGGALILLWIFGAAFYRRYEKYVVFWL